jgi:hypothetical protein
VARACGPEDRAPPLRTQCSILPNKPKKRNKNNQAPFIGLNCRDFLGQFCVIAKSGNHPQKDFARFGHKLLNITVKFSKHLSIFLATLLEQCIDRYLANFTQIAFRILAIGNLKKHMIFSTFNF